MLFYRIESRDGLAGYGFQIVQTSVELFDLVGRGIVISHEGLRFGLPVLGGPFDPSAGLQRAWGNR
jgi:hypothetical protein